MPFFNRKIKPMNIRIEKNGKGHDVYLNGEHQFWLMGSKSAAMKELERAIKNKQ